jgi:cytochrome c-type biogenesis protein CcmH
MAAADTSTHPRRALVTGRASRTPRTRTITLLTLLAAVCLCSLTPPALAATPPPRTSLTAVEQDVMCPSCREALAVAQSPQADSERAYIRKLVAEGLTKQQIEQNLVGQYGTAVLGRPPASGFNLTVYILPPALVAVGLAILAITLPRWRRRTRAAHIPAGSAPPSFDPAEAARLEQELGQFRG